MIVADDVIVNCAEAPVSPPRTEQSLSELGLSVIGFNPGDSTAGQSGSEPKTRTLTIDLICREDSEVSLPEAAYRLQQIVGQMQEEPETWIKRVPKVGGEWAGPVMYRIRRSPTAEEPQVTLSGLGGWQVGDNQPVTLTIVADFPLYSTEEVEGEEHSTTTARQLIYTEPAAEGSTKGLRRIRVTNDNEEGDWRGLIFASECRDYSADETAALWYECADLTPLGSAVAANTGTGPLVTASDLTKGWSTILGTEIDEVGHMTHRGGRRIWMRVEDPGETEGNIQLKLVWRALGSSRWEDLNPIATVYPVGDECLVDLGPVLPQNAVTGDQRWEGKVLARTTETAAGEILLRDFYPLPTEQYAKFSEPEDAPIDGEPKTLAGTLADATGVGTITWSITEGVPAVGFTPAGTTHYLKATNFGFAIPSGAVIRGIEAIITRGYLPASSTVKDARVRIIKSGTIKEAEDKASDEAWPAWLPGTPFHYGGLGDLWGNTWTASDINSSEFGVALSATGTEGAIAGVLSVAMTVAYTEGSNENAVCFASRTVELSTSGVIRQAPEDDVWGVVVPDGFLPYAAPGSLEGRTQRTIIIASQGDLEERADAGTPNKLTAQEFTRAGYHVAREAA